jgi:3-hydroxybutyryl-CoA dehydrogenase
VNKVDKIGIIGAGTMGTGIGSVSSLSGFETIIYDVNEQALNKSHAIIFRGFDHLLEKNKIDDAKRKESENLLTFTSDIKKVSNTDFIIEAAVENIDLKKIIYSQLDELTSQETILATNTSSFSVTALSSVVKKNRSRVIGMHFFNPANKMKLVEVVKGEFTSDNVVKEVESISKRLGKTPVICKDSPAFIVNRIARSFYGESLKIIGEGEIGFQEIDYIMKEEGGFNMGPFELMDLIGIDVNFSVTQSVYESFFYDPKYKPHQIQQRMIEAGMLGKKSGKGFYNYE